MLLDHPGHLQLEIARHTAVMNASFSIVMVDDVVTELIDRTKHRRVFLFLATVFALPQVIQMCGIFLISDQVQRTFQRHSFLRKKLQPFQQQRGLPTSGFSPYIDIPLFLKDGTHDSVRAVNMTVPFHTVYPLSPFYIMFFIILDFNPKHKTISTISA